MIDVTPHTDLIGQQILDFHAVDYLFKEKREVSCLYFVFTHVVIFRPSRPPHQSFDIWKFTFTK